MPIPAVLAAAAPYVGAGLSFVGSEIQGNRARRANREAGDMNADLQREFAQMGLRWRMRDARAAGVHPMYALGMNPVSASPSYVGGDDGAGVGLQNLGQDISRAVRANAGGVERQIMDENLKQEKIRTELLGIELAARNQDQAGPPNPIEEVPNKIVMSRPDAPSSEAGVNPSTAWNREGEWLIPTMTQKYAEQTEDSFPHKMRNFAAVNLMGTVQPSQKDIPEGYAGAAFLPGMGWRLYKKGQEPWWLLKK